MKPARKGGQLPHPPAEMSPPQDSRTVELRAGFELDSAYREMRRAELLLEQMESFVPPAPEIIDARQVLELASTLYRKSYQAYTVAQHLRAAEYAVAVKDLLRAVEKFYNIAITP